MATETRVVSDKKKKIGSGGAGGEEAGEAGGKKGKKKLFLIVGIVVALAAAAAGYFLVLAPKSAPKDGAEASAEATPEPKPGTVVKIDSVSINLAGGHYLRLGLALQLTADVKEAPETAHALDLAISLFSQQPVEQVTTAEGRDALKAKLLEQVKEAYEGEVMDLYFTDFVTQ